MFETAALHVRWASQGLQDALRIDRTITVIQEFVFGATLIVPGVIHALLIAPLNAPGIRKFEQMVRCSTISELDAKCDMTA